MRSASPPPTRHVPRAFRVGGLLCGAAGFLLGVPAAHAQVSFTLTYSSATTTANSEVFFYGTIANNSSTTVYYLNGLELVQNAGTTDSSFTPDSAPFDTYSDMNPTLAPGASYTGQLFGVKTNGSFNSNSQFYGTARLQGGTTNSDLSVLGMQNFTVTSSAAQPEPGSIAFLLTGAVVGGTMVIRRRTRRQAT